ncbi:hypothetical protein G9A89_006980 [Geosiphon pyriformis]|nr:hypothetical protein G9A89_006980 [Geosiphon pyriformis]
MDKTIAIESLSIIQKTQPKPSDISNNIISIEHQVTVLSMRYNPTENQHQQPHPKVAESESIGANHLEFMKSLFQHYCQHLSKDTQLLTQVKLQLPIQQQLIVPMAFAPITKIEKFIDKENDAQAWINDITKAITTNNWDDAKTMQVIPYFLKNTTNSWYYSLAQKHQNFNAFKIDFLRYFSDNNIINHLASTFITIKQENTEAVTTYLGCFHRNLRQIQAIQADYFTASQILN